MTPESAAVRQPQSMDGVEAVGAAMRTAQALGRALAETSTSKRFSVAFEAFQADAAVQRDLAAFQVRENELKMVAMWGGADSLDLEALGREWQRLTEVPSVSDYMRAQQDLTSMFREVAGRITDRIGVDYGAACSPGGCCG